MNARRVVLPALLTASLLSGCGGGDDEPLSAPASAAASAEPTLSPPAAESPAAGASPAAGGAYVDRDGFQITFPADWQVRPDVGGLQVIGTSEEGRSAGFQDNVGVVVEQTQQPGLTVEDYLEASVANAPKLLQQFEEVDQGTDGELGVLEYTAVAAGKPLHFLSYVTIEEGKAFTATYTATEATYAKGEAEARTVLRTLQAT